MLLPCAIHFVCDRLLGRGVQKLVHYFGPQLPYVHNWEIRWFRTIISMFSPLRNQLISGRSISMCPMSIKYSWVNFGSLPYSNECVRHHPSVLVLSYKHFTLQVNCSSIIQTCYSALKNVTLIIHICYSTSVKHDADSRIENYLVSYQNLQKIACPTVLDIF